MKKQLLILMTLFISVIGYSQTFTDNFITYTVTSITNNTVRVNSYNPAGGTDVDIPATVLNNSTTYNVTSIGDFAFVNNQLTSVVIPNSIININMSAFAQNQLSSFTIPNSVVSIGSGVLSGNPLTCVISEATTPPTITTGGSNDSFALNGDRSNIDLSIPSGTASAYATAEWTGFKSVAVGLTGTFVVDYITYQINPTPNSEVTITDYNVAGGNIVNIPTTVNSGCRECSVTDIGFEAFYDKFLISVTIPDGIITIGTSAFRENTINNLVIGNSIETIRFRAFLENNLTDIILPSNVSNIEAVAFGNNPLTDVFSESTTPPTITDDTFTSIANRSSIHLHIPGGASVLDAYTNASNGGLWAGFNPVTQDALLNTSNFELDNDIKVITSANEIKIISANTVSLKSYELYDMTGARVSKGTESIIPTGSLASGIYIIKLDFTEGSLVKKIAK